MRLSKMKLLGLVMVLLVVSMMASAASNEERFDEVYGDPESAATRVLEGLDQAYGMFIDKGPSEETVHRIHKSLCVVIEWIFRHPELVIYEFQTSSVPEDVYSIFVENEISLFLHYYPELSDRTEAFIRFLLWLQWASADGTYSLISVAESDGVCNQPAVIKGRNRSDRWRLAWEGLRALAGGAMYVGNSTQFAERSGISEESRERGGALVENAVRSFVFTWNQGRIEGR